MRDAVRRAPTFKAVVKLLQERCAQAGVRVVEEFTEELESLLTDETGSLERAVVISFGDSGPTGWYDDIAEARGQLEQGEFSVLCIASVPHDLWTLLDLVHDALDGKEPVEGSLIVPMPGSLRVPVESFTLPRRYARSAVFMLTIQ